MVLKKYGEVIKTSNGDGTEKVEIVGCKMIDNGNEIKVNLVFPRVSCDEQLAFLDYPKEENVLFTLWIPDDDE